MSNLKLPITFTIIAVIALLWNLMGIGAFVSDLTMDYSTATPEMQELLSRYPTWTKIPYAIAVFGGAIGALLLLLKNKLAPTFFFLSLIGIAIQMGHSIFIARAIDVYGPGGMIMPAMVLLIGIFLLYYSRSAHTKGWLQ